MAGTKTQSRRSASRSRRKFLGKTAPAPAPAHVLPRKPASRDGKRYWTPKELAAELTRVWGVPVSERTISDRCARPVGSKGAIPTLPAFPGRHFIPDEFAAVLLGEGRPA